jgi:protocatechuate 3,4-dioxygenase beta subunit
LALFLLFSFSAEAQQPTFSQLSEYWQVAPQAPAKVESPQFSQQNFTEKSFAKDQDDKKLLAILEEKKPTAARFFAADISMPDHFSTSNNLAKKVGSFYRAFGEIIFIKGTIVDSFGVPIEGAVVEVWQANAAGKYHTLLDPDSEYIDKYFNMSGRAITDNFGQYDFITIMPGSNPGRAPHINMNIYHQRFGKLETEMYFEEHPYNTSDYQYLAYDKEDRELLTAKVRRTNFRDKNSIKICTFNIVMRGIHQYKKY